MKIALVIPCFKSKKTILAILKKIDKSVKKILIIDDCCPEKTGRYIISKVKDSRIQVIFNKKNLGVGGAVLTGFKFLKYQNIDVIVKLDSDGQMNPENIIGLIKPILLSKADYTKGNRFYSFTNIFKIGPRSIQLAHFIT
jgi:glycosyltransferase involved in cell wall biosynthesis